MSPPVQERGWSSLPADLLRDILSRLPWSSHPSFAATCKHWSTIVSLFYPAWITPVLLNAVDVGSTRIRYYSPYYHKIFEVDETLDRPNATIYCSNGRHLTLWYRVDDKILVFCVNLVTGFIQVVHPLEGYNFDFVVYDGEHRMLGVNASVGTLNVVRNVEEDGDWSRYWEFSQLIHPEPKFKASPMTNPVLHHGLLYMLGKDGRLAVYDDRQHKYDDYYLFESDEGDLMAVLVDRRGSPLYVVKLNEDVMEWEKVESLEGRALFTGTLTTMMVKTDVKWMQKKIMFPRLHHWPDVVHCDLVDREGEVAFVPKSTMVSQDGAVEDKSIWTCGLGPDESAEFWGTANFDYKIWVNFEKIAS